MSPPKKQPSVDAVLSDLQEAGEAAKELVARGKDAWHSDRLLRLAGEAVIGRIADAAGRLPEEIRTQMPEVPWDDIRDIRILVDHVYHRIDYESLWVTLEVDVPHVMENLGRLRHTS